ncbi:MAG: hypothetical protein LUQ08_03435, partial [Methanothrix sp.]|nr:hypothetical protein [Methanothrix sp.]
HMLAGLCRSVPIFSLCIALLAWRILAEEKMLLRHLAVYHEYCQEMRYRLPHHVRWSTPEAMPQNLMRTANSSNIPEGLFLPLVSNSRLTQSTSLFQALYMEQTLTTTSARRYRQDISLLLLPERLKADQGLGGMPLKGEES